MIVLNCALPPQHRSTPECEIDTVIDISPPKIQIHTVSPYIQYIFFIYIFLENKHAVFFPLVFRRKHRRTHKDISSLKLITEKSFEVRDLRQREAVRFSGSCRKRWVSQNLCKSPRWRWLHSIDGREERFWKQSGQGVL